MRKNVLNSPRLLELKKHRRRSFQSKILLYLVALLAVFVFLIYIFRLTSLNISEVEIIGNKVLDAEVIKVIVKKELTGNYLGFFPKTAIVPLLGSSVLNISKARSREIVKTSSGSLSER